MPVISSNLSDKCPSMIRVVGIDPGLVGTDIGVGSGDAFKISDYAFGSVSTTLQEDLNAVGSTEF